MDGTIIEHNLGRPTYRAMGIVKNGFYYWYDSEERNYFTDVYYGVLCY